MNKPLYYKCNEPRKEGEPIEIIGTGKSIKEKIKMFLKFLDDKILYKLTATPYVYNKKDRKVVSKTYKIGWKNMKRTHPKTISNSKIHDMIPQLQEKISILKGGPITIKSPLTSEQIIMREFKFHKRLERKGYFK